MTQTLTLNRILLLVVSLLLMTKVSAKTTSWLGGAGSWALSTSWSHGLPASGDSVSISGVGSDVIFPNGFIVTIEYLEIKSGATLVTESGSILAVKGSATLSVFLDNATLTVQGLLSIPKSGSHSIFASAYTAVINEGTLVIDSTINGIFLGVESSLVNSGNLSVENATYGLVALTGSSIENDGLLDISKCVYSIDVRHNGYFENRDSVCVKEGSFRGLISYGEVVNNGKFSIVDMVGSSSIAILNDSFSCCDTFYIGKITNNGDIDVSNPEGDGLVCQPSTTLLNFGDMKLSNCAEKGILLEPMAQLRVQNGGKLTVSAIDAPLDVGDESNFVVRLGGTFDASIVDDSN